MGAVKWVSRVREVLAARGAPVVQEVRVAQAVPGAQVVRAGLAARAGLVERWRTRVPRTRRFCRLR